MKKNSYILAFALTGSFGLVQAADPVSWSLIPATGFSPTQVGQQSQVTYTLRNNLPFAVTILTDYRFTGSGFSTYDTCKNKNLAPKEQCQINFLFKPHARGNSSVQLFYTYNRNQISLPSLQAIALGAPATAVVGSIFGLPSTISLNPLQQPDFIATYSNNSDIPVTGFVGDVSNSNLITSSSNASIAILRNTCGTYTAPITLQPHKDCQIEGQLTPLAIGPITLNSKFTFDGVHISPITASSLIIPGGGGSCTVHGQTQLPLPSTTYQYADNMVKFQFENECTSASTTLGQVVVSANFSPNTGQQAVVTTSTVYDNCSGQTLSPQANCSVLVSVSPQDPATQMTVSAQVSAGGVTSAASTSSSVISNNLTANHVVHFVNQCPFNVWYGIANGTGSSSPDPTPGSQSAQGAPSSSYFLAEQQNGQAPSTIDLSASVYVNGSIWARTGCASDGSNFACATGMCNTLSPTSGTCVPSGQSFNQPVPPYTKFEFSLSNTPGGDGVYDVSLINGFNVPVEIKGLGPVSTSDPFQCTGAGAVLQPNTQLGACSWTFNPAFSGLSKFDFVWVSPGSSSNCTSDADCSGGDICGMAFSSSPANAPINRRCGRFLGYSTLANYFGYSSSGQWGSPLFNLYSKYNIGTPMSSISAQNYGTGAIFGNLLSCIPTDTNSANTCYNAASNLPTCCGCVNWDSSVVPTATASSCLGINQDWVATAGTSVTVLNAILWLKKTCPTAYSYQFDDPSSSFTCNPSLSNKTDYQVTFCPGGQTGLPTNAVDGR
ncbi:thaumatin family protein [Legionella cardiaca]|uniref:Thaumatin family protein n=1 Tax=Legionella cardiaca TaxID=1071983 RepID=A0ABY8AMT2_9GAMM|nr:thaumatin family protein [Legionella cardiaca]WED41955.1 thaumatin family protein [Legionella cardiaca]